MRKLEMSILSYDLTNAGKRFKLLMWEKELYDMITVNQQNELKIKRKQ